MDEVDNFILTAKDGTTINGREWLVPHPKFAICLIHGLGEHIGRYEHVANFFNTHQVSFFAIDLRGHGLSEGKRGHTPSYELLLDDVEELLMHARAEHNDLPIFLYGHSLGGNIVANYILRRNTNELHGAIISAPWFELAQEPAEWQVKLAKAFSRFLPSFTQSNQLDINHLTNDNEVNLAYKTDPLVHDKISTRMFTACYQEGFWAINNAHKNKIPLFIFHGSKDSITSSNASKEFAKRSAGQVDYKLWDDVKHEPHNDIKKEEVLKSGLDWLVRQS